MVESYHWQNATALICLLTAVDLESLKHGSILPLAECDRTHLPAYSFGSQVCQTW
jgi:hypothetical protein